MISKDSNNTYCQEFIEYYNKSNDKSFKDFDYNKFITIEDAETNLLYLKIVEEFQYLDDLLNDVAIKKLNKELTDQSFIPTTNIVKELIDKGIIKEEIGERIILLYKFRNFLINNYFTSNMQYIAQDALPFCLFLIFETIDYFINLLGYENTIHTPNELGDDDSFDFSSLLD